MASMRDTGDPSFRDVRTTTSRSTYTWWRSRLHPRKRTRSPRPELSGQRFQLGTSLAVADDDEATPRHMRHHRGDRCPCSRPRRSSSPRQYERCDGRGDREPGFHPPRGRGRCPPRPSCDRAGAHHELVAEPRDGPSARRIRGVRHGDPTMMPRRGKHLIQRRRRRSAVRRDGHARRLG
jgi:hypothetical protein